MLIETMKQNLGLGAQAQGIEDRENIMRDDVSALHLVPYHEASTSSPNVSAPVEAAPSSVPNAADLTPEGLMAYCSARLSNLDSQMNGIMTEQQQNGQTTTDVNAIASALDDLPGPNSANPPVVAVSSSDAATIEAAYGQAMADCPHDSELWNSLNKDLTSFTTQLGQGDTVPSTLVGSLGQSAKNYASDLNSDSEMQMITLQSLMSQRETAVQLTTNLIQSLGQQSTDITKNVGQ